MRPFTPGQAQRRPGCLSVLARTDPGRRCACPGVEGASHIVVTNEDARVCSRDVQKKKARVRAFVASFDVLFRDAYSSQSQSSSSSQ